MTYKTILNNNWCYIDWNDKGRYYINKATPNDTWVKVDKHFNSDTHYVLNLHKAPPTEDEIRNASPV